MTSCPCSIRAQSAVIVGLVAVALALAAACGGGAAPALSGNPTKLVRIAASRTIAVRTAHVDLTVGIGRGPGLVGSGVVDFSAGRAQLTFLRTGSDARRGDRFALVVDGADGYLAGVAPAAAGGSLVRGLLPAVAEKARVRITPLDSLLVRPGAGTALALLRGARNVLPYGGQEVQGTSTMRYSFVVDLDAAAAASSPRERPALAAAANALGGTQEPADVWLDSMGRVRRLQFATDPRLRTTTTKANFFTEDGEFLSFIVIDFSQFGSPAPVTVPPALRGPSS